MTPEWRSHDSASASVADNVALYLLCGAAMLELAGGKAASTINIPSRVAPAVGCHDHEVSCHACAEFWGHHTQLTTGLAVSRYESWHVYL